MFLRVLKPLMSLIIRRNTKSKWNEEEERKKNTNAKPNRNQTKQIDTKMYIIRNSRCFFFRDIHYFAGFLQCIFSSTVSKHDIYQTDRLGTHCTRPVWVWLKRESKWIRKNVFFSLHFIHAKLACTFQRFTQWL